METASTYEPGIASVSELPLREAVVRYVVFRVAGRAAQVAKLAMRRALRVTPSASPWNHIAAALIDGRSKANAVFADVEAAYGTSLAAAVEAERKFKKPRGFAAMPVERRNSIARQGGEAVQRAGLAHRFEKGEEASRCGRIGGRVRREKAAS